MLTFGFPLEDESAVPLPVYGVAALPETTLQGLPVERCVTPALGNNQASSSPCLMIC